MGTFRPLEEATGGDALGGDGEANGGGAVAALGVAPARERTPDGEMDGAFSFSSGEFSILIRPQWASLRLSRCIPKQADLETNSDSAQVLLSKQARF